MTHVDLQRNVMFTSLHPIRVVVRVRESDSKKGFSLKLHKMLRPTQKNHICQAPLPAVEMGLGSIEKHFC